MARKDICAVCGKEAFREGMCRLHCAERHALVEVKPKYEVTVCSRCGLIKIGNRWVQWVPGNFLKAQAKIHGRLINFNVSRKGNAYTVMAEGLLDIGLPKLEERKVIIHENKVVCPVCTRISGGYYEAVLQLRGEFTGQHLEEIDNMVARLATRDRKAFYRTKELREGIDLYFGSKSVAKKAANMLKRNHQAELKSSFRIAGKKEGRELRRTIISARLPKKEAVPNI